MTIVYITLNNIDEARLVGRKILDARLANCVNWFPITCLYRWEGKVTEEPEVVLLVKTKEEHFRVIEKLVKELINYTNCIAEIEVGHQRKEFLEF